MFIDDECEGSDEESNNGDLEDVDIDGDINMVDANAGHVDDGGIFVSEGNADATGPTVAGLIWRDHNHRVSGDADGCPHEPRLVPRYHEPRLDLVHVVLVWPTFVLLPVLWPACLSCALCFMMYAVIPQGLKRRWSMSWPLRWAIRNSQQECSEVRLGCK